jgi:hypothetical protein
MEPSPAARLRARRWRLIGLAVLLGLPGRRTLPPFLGALPLDAPGIPPATVAQKRRVQRSIRWTLPEARWTQWTSFLR